MTIDTTKLRELSQNATPGPWEQINHIVFTETGDLEWVVANARSGNSIIDAEYIAAANPATVLELLDALDDAHRNMDDFGLLADKKTSECRSLINWVNDIAEDLSIPEDSVDGMSIGDAIFRLKQIEAAARNLAKVKGRHHSEQAMNQLLEALG